MRRPVGQKNVGCQMANKPLLTIELVPATSWGDSLKKKLGQHNWDSIRRPVYRNADYRCEVCGGAGTEYPVECHEIWHYDDNSKVRKLIGFVALCPECHRVKHFGRSVKIGRGEEAHSHLMQVNDWTEDEARDYEISCLKQWQERSVHDWKIDVTLLQQYGIKETIL